MVMGSTRVAHVLALAREGFEDIGDARRSALCSLVAEKRGLYPVVHGEAEWPRFGCYDLRFRQVHG